MMQADGACRRKVGVSGGGPCDRRREIDEVTVTVGRWTGEHPQPKPPRTAPPPASSPSAAQLHRISYAAAQHRLFWRVLAPLRNRLAGRVCPVSGGVGASRLKPQRRRGLAGRRRCPSSCDRASSGRCRACAPSATFARDSGRARSGSSRLRSLRVCSRRRCRRSGAADWDRAVRSPSSGEAKTARRRRSAIDAGAGGMRTSKPSTCAAICGNSATVSSSPSASTTARNIAFSSWRTLPGHS